MSKINFNPEACTGCRLCEIMCAYHHKRVFSRRISSIEISEFLKKENRKMVLHHKGENGHLACDQCKGIKEPLCVKYCYTRAIVVGEG